MIGDVIMKIMKDSKIDIDFFKDVISDTAIVYIIRGQRMPHKSTLEIILKACKIDYYELFLLMYGHKTDVDKKYLEVKNRLKEDVQAYRKRKYAPKFERLTAGR